MAYHRQQGVDTRDRPHLQHVRAAHAPDDGRAIPNFMRQALESKPLTVFGDGSQTRSFCYVDDLIRGLYLLARERRAPTREHREPGRVHDARARRDGHQGHRRRRARSSSRRCRSTTRRCASPTSPARKQVLGWEPESSSRKGSDGCSASAGARPCVSSSPSRRPLLVLAGLAAPSASPRREAHRRASSTSAVTYRQPGLGLPARTPAGVEALRANLYWGGPNGVAEAAGPRTPSTPPTRPTTGGRTTALSSSARGHGIKPVFTIYGTPSWANGASRRTVRRRTPDRPAATSRMRRRSATAAPSVAPDGRAVAGRCGTGWPGTSRTTRSFLLPQYVRTAGSGSPRRARVNYAQICNASSRASTARCSAPRRWRAARRPARQQQPATEPGPPSRRSLPARAQDGRPAAVRRLRAPSVLPDARATPPRRSRRRDAVGHAREHRRADPGADPPVRPSGSGSRSTATRRTRPTGSSASSSRSRRST